MLTVQIQNPFIEQRVKKDFKGDTQKLINEIVDFLKNKEKNERALAKAYERGDLSTGEIAEKLEIHKEDVLELLNKYDVYYADYDLEEERERLKNLRKIFNIKEKA